MTANEPHPALNKSALFRSLGYEPHAGQALVHRSKASRRVLACGVRWGKTTAAAMEALSGLLEPRERALGWLVGPTYLHAERIFGMVVLTLEKHLPHRIREHDRRRQRLLVQNLAGGLSELWAKTADNPASLLGDGIDFLILDEAAQVKREIWDLHLSQRLLDRGGWALLASTPRGREWFHRQWRRGQRGRDKDYESWQSPSCVNPHLDRTLIEAERGRLEPGSFAEQYEAHFRGPDLDPCDLCHGPDPEVPGLVLAMTNETLSHCAECKRPVDANGHTLVPAERDGSPKRLLVFRGEWSLGAQERFRANVVEHRKRMRMRFSAVEPSTEFSPG